jgi:N utilization substance protein B
MKFKDKTIGRTTSFKFLYFLLFERGIDSLAEVGEHLEEELELFTHSLDVKEKEEPDYNLTQDSLFASRQIIGKAVTEYLQIEDKINQFSNGKCNKIERALIYSAVAESMTFKDTPKKVLINEYIELAKKFGTKSSSSFINAFLDKAITSLE